MSQGSSSKVAKLISKVSHDDTSFGASRSALLRLPDEILMEILAYIDREDVNSLRNICIAVKSDRRVYQLAHAQRWKEVTIDEQDLVPAPRQDTSYSKKQQRRLKRLKLGSSWKPRGHNVNVLVKEINGIGIPANYIQDLVFDLRMSRYFTKPLRRSDIMIWDLMPSSEFLRHSLSLLKPHLINIRSVRCYGDLSQDIVDTIGGLTSNGRVHSFELQRYRGQGRLRGPNYWRYQLQPERRLSKDLRPLQSLVHLKSLEIHRLASAEVSSLWEVLPKLLSLQHLLIADEADDSANACAIRTLFDDFIGGKKKLSAGLDQFQSSSTLLPQSLKSFKCIDRHPCRLSNLRPVQSTTKLAATFIDLYLDTDLLAYILDLLRSLDCKQLKVLSIPGANNRYQAQTQFEEMNKVIALHESTLERINILRAWDLSPTFSDDFNRQWFGKYTIQELVLGSERPSWYDRLSPEKQFETPSPVLANYLDALSGNVLGYLACPGQWGVQLKRIRIDHIPPSNIDTSILRHPRFDNLKILMLQPFDDSTIADVEIDRWFENSCKLISETSARLLANTIASDSKGKLRIVVVQSYWYWIPVLGVASLDVQCMTWCEARENLNEARMMSDVISEADWMFLRNDSSPFWNTRFHPDLDIHLENRPPRSVSIVSNQWNYLTALPSSSTQSRNMVSTAASRQRR